MKLWRAAPEWAFRALGASFFLAVLLSRLPAYGEGFWELGPVYRHADGRVVHVPWVNLLIDATFFVMALGFATRHPPRARQVEGKAVLLGLLGSVWPLLPFLLDGALGWWAPGWQADLRSFTWRPRLGATAMVAGTALMLVGNGLDLWGYGTLFRSIGIVPEARVLKTNGPYRFVRHPVYLGHLLSQAGVWLFFARTHALWIGFYLLFVLLQLSRARLEDRVLAEAFGVAHADWRRRTFWFT